MSVFEHSRWKIFNPAQHPLMHDLSAFGYTNESLPGVSNLDAALDYIVAVLYPKTKLAVADLAELNALVGNTINDMRVVLDDGDGKAAAYRWEWREDEVAASWHKVYDMDWGTDNILSQFLLKTQDVYVYKYGLDDRDKDGILIAGTFAGQTIYGGNSASTNLTLKANSGDGVGPHTGYVQVDDHFRPCSNGNWDVGTLTEKFRTGYFTTSLLASTLTISGGSITDTTGAISFDNENLSTVGTISGTQLFGTTSGVFGSTLTISTGSITDSTGALSFDNENLTTTGTLSSGTHTVSSTLVMASGSITDTTGAINFDNENLLTTGTLGAGNTTVTRLDSDNIRIDGNTISVLNVDGNLILVANGAGVVDVQSTMTTLGQTVTGILGITGQLNIDNLRLDANTISSTNLDGNIILDPNGAGLIELGAGFFPTTNSVNDIGKTGNVWNDLWIDGNIQDGTLTFSIANLMKLRLSSFRDFAGTLPAQAGDSLFYDAVNGVWLASAPDTEITHGGLAGLTTGDAGHTQFAMLAGRAGGQTVQGGTGASENFILESTAHGTKGLVLFKDTLAPFTDASYSGGWQGTDLGNASHYLRDIYSKGEHKGLRFENFTSLTLPSPSATAVGRVVYSTDDKRVYIDDGTTYNAIGGSAKFVQDVVFDGIVTTKDVDVSAVISDARITLKQLFDNSNDFEIMPVTIKATSISNVRIETNVPLPAGSYRLIVIE